MVGWFRCLWRLLCPGKYVLSSDEFKTPLHLASDNGVFEHPEHPHVKRKKGGAGRAGSVMAVDLAGSCVTSWYGHSHSYDASDAQGVVECVGEQSRRQREKVM
jgi:hypothetical protein